MKNINKMKDYYNFVIQCLSKSTTNIMSLFVELYPQNRVKHLVRYGNSKRIRNKNASRILKEIRKEIKQEKDYRYSIIDIARKLK